jgi:hypothetical protein
VKISDYGNFNYWYAFLIQLHALLGAGNFMEDGRPVIAENFRNAHLPG